MRLLPAVAIGLAFVVSATAHAESLHVLPFANRCFDAARLAANMATRGVQLDVGESHAGQEVKVTSAGDGLDVRITARDAVGRESGVELRHIADGPCDALLETTELIVLRAATPLHFMPQSTPKPKAPPHHHEHVVEQAPQPQPPHEEPPHEEPPHEAAPVVTRRIEVPVQLARPPADEPPHERPTPHVYTRPRVELAVHGLWIFPLDHAPSRPAGDVELGVRWSKRVGLALRAGVAKDWRSTDHSGDSAAALDVRRIPIALLLGVDLPIRHGLFRVSVGPLVDLWRVESTGVSQTTTTWLAQPALLARGAYRYTVRRVFFEAGLDFELGVVRHDLVVTGVGTISHTPLVDLAPFLGVGVSL